MDERTVTYLRGRFGDHYRTTTIPAPPAAHEREWGYIPWASGQTRMSRHKSTLDLGGFGEGADLSAFLERERPRHVYFSAARYRDPAATGMAAKGWRGADLIFDLDADHLPSVDPASDSHGTMLAACKEALEQLLDFLERDFGFTDLAVVFSGGRGYHVHVRDGAIRQLSAGQRRQIVDYLLGNGIDLDSLVETETVGGLGRKTPARKRTLPTDGGWPRRVHDRLLSVIDEVLALPEEEAIQRLMGYEGIGKENASAALTAAQNNYDEIAAGNIDVHQAFIRLATAVTEETVHRDRAPIDEPVTTDVNRLIRLPGSLHGGTGLRVTPLERVAISEFEPLADAIPSTFRGQNISIHVTEPGEVELDGNRFTVTAGDQRVPEPVGVYLMAAGRAEKGREPG